MFNRTWKNNVQECVAEVLEISTARAQQEQRVVEIPPIGYFARIALPWIVPDGIHITQCHVTTIPSTDHCPRNDGRVHHATRIRK